MEAVGEVEQQGQSYDRHHGDQREVHKCLHRARAGPLGSPDTHNVGMPGPVSMRWSEQTTNGW